MYEAALAEMLADGTVYAKDRRALAALRTRLGLWAAETETLERVLAARLAAAA